MEQYNTSKMEYVNTKPVYDMVVSEAFYAQIRLQPS